VAFREADLTQAEEGGRGPKGGPGSATARIEAEIRATLAGLDETVAALGWRLRHGTAGERAVARSMRGVRRGWVTLWSALDRWPVAGVGAFFLLGVGLGLTVRGRR
jgi:hypothetical protein